MPDLMTKEEHEAFLAEVALEASVDKWMNELLEEEGDE